MNRIPGTIIGIEENEYLSLIKVKAKIGDFYVLLLESTKTTPSLRINAPVYLLFKETEIEIFNLNCQFLKWNTFSAIISKMEKGKILSYLELLSNDISLFVTLPTKWIDFLNLENQSSILGYIRPTEISLEWL